MQVHTKQLEKKRRDLQLRCELQRHHVAQLTGNIETRLAIVDRVVTVTSTFFNRPILLLGAVAGLVLIGRWRLLRWAGQGAMLFSAARKIQNLLAKQ